MARCPATSCLPCGRLPPDVFSTGHSVCATCRLTPRTGLLAARIRAVTKPSNNKRTSSTTLPSIRTTDPMPASWKVAGSGSDMQPVCVFTIACIEAKNPTPAPLPTARPDSPHPDTETRHRSRFHTGTTTHPLSDARLQKVVCHARQKPDPATGKYTSAGFQPHLATSENRPLTTAGKKQPPQRRVLAAGQTAAQPVSGGASAAIQKALNKRPDRSLCARTPLRLPV